LSLHFGLNENILIHSINNTYESYFYSIHIESAAKEQVKEKNKEPEFQLKEELCIK